MEMGMRIRNSTKRGVYRVMVVFVHVCNDARLGGLFCRIGICHDDVGRCVYISLSVCVWFV